MFVEILDSHAPLKTICVKRQGCPWITPKIRALMKKRNYQCKVAKKTNLPDDWNYYRKLCNTVTMEMRKAKLIFFDHVSEGATTNPRGQWKETNKLLGGKRKQVTEVHMTENK